MSAIAEHNEIITDDWRGLYREGWKGLITEQAFAHPAKFSRALIRRIYDHALEMEWLSKGDSVVDPFGGVALGGFDAMRHGLHWVGCELESRFCLLANGLDCDGSQCPDCQQVKESDHQTELFTRGGAHRYQGNLDLWRAMRLPGTARLIQGDSRRLASAVEESQCCVSSPPYTAAGLGNNGKATDMAQRAYKHCRETGEAGTKAYGSDPANLGNLRASDTGLAAAISSPPYSESLKPETEDQTARKQARIARSKTLYDGRRIEPPSPGKASMGGGYGITEGNIGSMPEGDLRAVISSPPFAESLASDEPKKRGGLFRDPKRANDKTLTATYGTEPGNLGLMKASVSSPPYEGSEMGGNGGEGPNTKWRNGAMKAEREIQARNLGEGYGKANGQLGGITGSDFWSAARTIIEQLHQVLSPNAHAIWVVKGFIRNKALVDFPAQWRALCEAAGFETLHIHRCWLVEHHGEQHNFMGEIESIETHKKSFFRRIHEKKYPDLSIDYETVLCMRKV